MPSLHLRKGQVAALVLALLGTAYLGEHSIASTEQFFADALAVAVLVFIDQPVQRSRYYLWLNIRLGLLLVRNADSRACDFLVKCLCSWRLVQPYLRSSGRVPEIALQTGPRGIGG